MSKQDKRHTAAQMDIYQDTRQTHKWPETLVNYIDVVTAQLEREHIDNANELALGVVMALSNYGGGRIIYLPKGETLKTAIRDNKIFKEFNGRNVDTLASAYKITVPHTYAIIKTQRKLHLNKAQPQLFE